MFRYIAKFLPSIVKALPYLTAITEFFAAIFFFCVRLSCKKSILAILIIAYIVVCLICIGCIYEPYAVEVDHPIETVGRLIDLVKGE